MRTLGSDQKSMPEQSTYLTFIILSANCNRNVMMRHGRAGMMNPPRTSMLERFIMFTCQDVMNLSFL
jgi:hypothetical protein